MPGASQHYVKGAATVKNSIHGCAAPTGNEVGNRKSDKKSPGFTLRPGLCMNIKSDLEQTELAASYRAHCISRATVSVQNTLRSLSPDMITSTRLENLCQEDPTPWCDNRSNIHDHKFSVFTNKIAMETIWEDDLKIPKRVKLKTKKPCMTIGRVSFQSGNNVGRAGNAFHKWLPQLHEVKEMHAQITADGNELQLFEINSLLDMYVKCGSMVDARHVFDNMPKRDVVSWNVMILGYAQGKEGAIALGLYTQMYQEGVKPSHRTFVAVLKACSMLATLEEGKQVDRKNVNLWFLEKGRAIHSQAVSGGFESDVFVGTTLVDFYVKCGSMVDAQHVFDKLPCRDVVSWTAMISGYGQKEEGVLALELYAKMHQEGVHPNDRTFVAALKACGSLATLEEEKQINGKLVKTGCLVKGLAIHSEVVKCGFESNVFVGTILIDMFAKCGSVEDARHVFDEMPERNVVSWTSMILGYAQKEEGALALELYVRMYQEGVIPDRRTYVGALKACSSLAALEDGTHVWKFFSRAFLEKGRAIHCHVITSGFESDVFVGTALVDMYAKCGSMEDARLAFDSLPYHDVISWNAMISGYAQKEEGALALKLYGQMRQEGAIPDHRTFVGVMNACSSLAALEAVTPVHGHIVKTGCLEKGRAIHSHVVESCFMADVFVGNTLVDMYAKSGSVEDARHVFDELTHRDVVSWTAMILGYVEHGESEQAFKLYAEMQEQGLPENSVTFVSILKACGSTAALETGKELHAQICRLGLETTAIVATTLIDMYAKCGSMVDAKQLFNALPTKDFVTWHALISGYARQGESEVVFDLFERMLQEGIRPNGVTFRTVLTVCSHVGLVEQGQKYFQAMSKQYGVIPNIEHYNCMIDLLGRAGQVEEAAVMADTMPFEPNVVSWFVLLAACRKWKNVEVGRHAFAHAVRLDWKSAAAYVLMSNIYADAHMWEDCEKIEVMRTNSQASMKSGRSWWTDIIEMVDTCVVKDIHQI